MKETQPHERRLALIPDMAAKLTKLGSKLHMQSGAGDTINLPHSAFSDVIFMQDRLPMVSKANPVLAVQSPALEVVRAKNRERYWWCFVYAHQHETLEQLLLDKKITCFVMERLSRTTRTQATDALSSKSTLAGP